MFFLFYLIYPFLIYVTFVNDHSHRRVHRSVIQDTDSPFDCLPFLPLVLPNSLGASYARSLVPTSLVRYSVTPTSLPMPCAVPTSVKSCTVIRNFARRFDA